jgi:putative heme-binding domain-containing protein
MRLIRNSTRLLLAAFLLAAGIVISTAHAQDSWEDDFKKNPPPGKGTFDSTCAGCHGLDGRGSEKAPNIASSAKIQHLADAQLADIVKNGVPGTGMPASRSLTAAQVRSLVSYLRILQGKGAARALPGNASRGKTIFSGKGECSNCHAFSGAGGFLGPDLTAYGSQMPLQEILKALTNPARIVPNGFKAAAVTTRDGNHVEGLVRNEDNFSVQLQSQDGSFHFYQKADLQSFEYLTQSSMLMPRDYGTRLTHDELNDLISYLMSAAAPPTSGRNSKPKQGTTK